MPLGHQGEYRYSRGDQRQRPVLELAGCQGLRVEVRDLLQLERPLLCHGVVQPPSDKEHVAPVGQAAGQ